MFIIIRRTWYACFSLPGVLPASLAHCFEKKFVEQICAYSIYFTSSDTIYFVTFSKRMIISNNLSFENSLSERDINFPTQLIKGTTQIILEQIIKDLITWARRRSIDSIGTDGWLVVRWFIHHIAYNAADLLGENDMGWLMNITTTVSKEYQEECKEWISYGWLLFVRITNTDKWSEVKSKSVLFVLDSVK